MLLLDLFNKEAELTDHKLYAGALDIAIKITNSKIGFSFLVSDDLKEIILSIWSEGTMKCCSTALDNRIPLGDAGNWAYCVKEKKSFVCNNYFESLNQKGFPEGHAEIHRLMGFPVIQHDQARLIFGVGNKEEDYNDSDLTWIESVFLALQKIFEKRNVEKNLLWNEAFLKEIAESSPLAFLVVDDRTDEVLFINHQFCELWGINHLEEAIRKRELKSNDVISGCYPMLKDVPTFIELCKTLQSEENRVVVEDRIPFADGRIIRRFSTQVRDSGDQYHGRLYTFEDITQRKNSEKLIVIQRDLATRLSATSDLHEALSHTLDSIFLIGGIDVCGIYLVDINESGLTLSIHRGLSAKFVKEKSFFDSDSPQVKLVLAGKPVYEFYKPEFFVDMAYEEHEKILSIAVIPVKHEGKVIGAFIVGSRTSDSFCANIQVSIESLASQIGGTISRINAENALHSSQQNFRMLFDTINDFMFVLDLEGMIIKTNTVVEKRLGYTAEELQQLHVIEIHHPERREEALLFLDEMLAGKNLYCPVPLYTKTGTQIPVETHMIMGKWDGKDVLLGISRDVTEREKTEAALRESEARWSFALEGSGDGVWDWNVQTDEVFYSNQWKAMIGYTDSEIGNKMDEWDKRIHPDDRAACYADMSNHFSGETEIFSNEHRLLCKDGSYKWILDRGKVVARQPDGKPLRVIGTHTDVSKRKELEESLRSAISKEKELNELKSRFVSMASHEFRTPLSSILMLDDSLMAYWKRMDDQQIISKLQNIKDQVQHLTNVVTDVMLVSKIQEGKLSYDPKNVDLVELCHGVIKAFNTDKLLKNKINFNSDFDDLFMCLDNRLIVQVLNNLISNAIKYAQPVPIVKVRLYYDRNEVLLSIHDNGIGIPEADQKNLFQPFYRAENVRHIQGNGLGLNIVRESVQLHGGDITFDSILGKGSTFFVHLPKKLISKI